MSEWDNEPLTEQDVVKKVQGLYQEATVVLMRGTATRERLSVIRAKAERLRPLVKPDSLSQFELNVIIEATEWSEVTE